MFRRSSSSARSALWTAAFVLTTGSAVRADQLFNGFSSTAGLQLNGAAATATTVDGPVLRVTPALGSQAGSVFSFAKVSTAEFTSIFSFRITNNGGTIFDFNNETGADGITFVVQNVANNVGSAGQGIGYEGIGTSVGVEFDTWGNSFNNDPSQSHVAIDVNGSVNHAAAGQGPTKIIGNSNAATTDLPGPELDDGNRWWGWVRYNGSSLQLFLLMSEQTTEPPLPATPILSHPINLAPPSAAARRRLSDSPAARERTGRITTFCIGGIRRSLLCPSREAWGSWARREWG